MAKKLNCSALTSAQIVAVVGGDVDTHYSEPLGGCDWSLTNSSLSSADTAKNGVFTVRILPGYGSSESEWEHTEQALDYAPLPAIGGRPAVFENDTGSVSVWDSTQATDVQIVVIDWTPDVATKAEIRADTIKLADDVFAS